MTKNDRDITLNINIKRDITIAIIAGVIGILIALIPYIWPLIFPPQEHLPDGSIYEPSNDISRELSITFAASGMREQIEDVQQAMIKEFESILPKKSQESFKKAFDKTNDIEAFREVFIDVYSRNLTLQEVIEINQFLLSSDYQEYEEIEKKVTKIQIELMAEYLKRLQEKFSKSVLN